MQANKYLQSKPEFVSAGVTTYEKFIEIDIPNDKLSKLKDKFIFEDNVDMFWELQTREQLIIQYEGIERIVNRNPSRLNKNQLKRYNETINNGSISIVIKVIFIIPNLFSIAFPR